MGGKRQNSLIDCQRQTVRGAVVAVAMVASIARCWVSRGCGTLSTVDVGVGVGVGAGAVVLRVVLGADVGVAVDVVAAGIRRHCGTTSSPHPPCEQLLAAMVGALGRLPGVVGSGPGSC